MSTHACQWPKCAEQVPANRWGCKAHWLKLPELIRSRIWGSYRPGQEDDKEFSASYLRALKAAQDWIAQDHPQTPQLTDAQKAKLKGFEWEKRMHMKLDDGHQYRFRCAPLKITKAVFNEYAKGKFVKSHISYYIDDDEAEYSDFPAAVTALEQRGAI